jgi:hypothetical protein
MQHFQPLIEALEPQLVAKLSTSEHTMAFQLAISLWSFATLGHYNSSTFFAILLRSLQLAHRFKPVDVAHVIWACGVTSHSRSHFVLSSLLSAIEPRLDEFQGRELAAMVWGMSRVNAGNNTIMLHAAQRIIDAPGGLRSREIVTILYSFTRIRYTGIRETGVHISALHELVQPVRLASLNPQDITMAVWAMARIKAEVPFEELDVLATRATQLVQTMNQGEMAATAYGFAMLGCQHKRLLCALADRTLHLRKHMRYREKAIVLWALGKAVVVPAAGVLEGFAADFTLHMRVLPPLTLANVAKAFAKLRFTPPEDFMTLLTIEAAYRVEDFQMAELSNLLWALQQLQWLDLPLCQAVEDVVTKGMHRCTQDHITSLISSFRGLGYRPENLIAAARACSFQA